MSRRKDKLREIVQDIIDSSPDSVKVKEVSTTMLEQAIMRNVGFSEATIKQYKRALEAHGLMKPRGNGKVWVIL